MSSGGGVAGRWNACGRVPVVPVLDFFTVPVIVSVIVEAVVLLPLLIDREAGLSGERTGKGGEPGVGGGEI